MFYVKRFLKPVNQSFFFLVQGGTRKSHWVKYVFPEALNIDLLDPEYLKNFTAYPERLKELIAGNNEKKDIVID